MNNTAKLTPSIQIEDRTNPHRNSVKNLNKKKPSENVKGQFF